MRCYCCDCEIRLARKVRLRPWREYDPQRGGPRSAAYESYKEEMTYRWAVICQACYMALDNSLGISEIGGRLFNLAGASRGDKAATIDEPKYWEFRRKEAAKLGLDLEKDAR
jgi:hypothetical protein